MKRNMDYLDILRLHIRAKMFRYHYASKLRLIDIAASVITCNFAVFSVLKRANALHSDSVLLFFPRTIWKILSTN